MKKFARVIILLMLSFVLAFLSFGCDNNTDPTTDPDNGSDIGNNNNGNNNNGNNGGNNNGGNNGGTGTIEYDFDFDQDFLDFFDIQNRITITINISKAQIQLIQDDYDAYSLINSKSPIYRICDVAFTVDGETTYNFDEVGIRMKGNTSRRDFYDNGLFDIIHFKLSFQETFDGDEYDNPKTWADSEARKARKDRTFLGMEKLDLKWNKNHDTTFIKEWYALNFFREAGVMAPMSNLAHTTLNIGGVAHNLGVYQAYETVDEPFFERRLKDEDLGGDLYKCAYTGMGAADFRNDVYKIGIEDEDEAYFPPYDLKTNKKTSTHAALKTLLSVVNNNNKTVQDICDLVDMDYFTSFEAVSYLVGNPDDLRNNYNNFYIYFLQSSGKVVFIPYDYDRCYGINYEWNPTGSGMVNVQPFTRQAISGNQNNPLYRRTIIKEGDAALMEMFAQKLETLSQTKYMNATQFDTYFQIAKSHYQNVTVPHSSISHARTDFSNSAQTVLNSTTLNIDFNTYVTKKLKTLNDNL